MIFVGVSNDASIDAIDVLLEIGEVWEDRVDAWLGLVGEHLPTVENDHASLGFEDRAIATDVAEPTKECDSYGRCHLETGPPQVRQHLSTLVFEASGLRAHRQATLTTGQPEQTKHGFAWNRVGTKVTCLDVPGLEQNLVEASGLGHVAAVKGLDHLAGLDTGPMGGHTNHTCLLYTSPSPRDQRGSRMPSSA